MRHRSLAALLPLLLGLFALLALEPRPALACGPDSACTVGARTYRIALPEGDGPFGAIVYSHGYGATAEGVMNFAALREVADRLGVALIALDSASKGWLIRNAPRRGLDDDAIELAAFDAVLDDAAERFAIDSDRLLAAGFSGGGMMTWTLACRRGDRFFAFVPVAGTFWAPLPRDCPNPPVDLLHIHGTADTVVPLDGRAIADTRQGVVDEALVMFRAAAHHGAPMPIAVAAGLTCEQTTGDDETRIVECLHEGGHMVDAGWIEAGWRMFAGE
ncbi:PHB depolymerase family esterase [Acuticoccus sp. I52.16.1]|uniref:alpha/beta hydrolase family esterase n=1 Tax=Acuticoccus sp. I52.16.1 TaxID=2928472 RepID=UPI001FD5C44C|nr:prolyl oligopeptidase family serine peptidase [Acuticoccus sp. I52.16.1]UOM32552.1 prolyl oligopeptidase family serine peptidase [Acuticoccus sp. I52.16.1]